MKHFLFMVLTVFTVQASAQLHTHPIPSTKDIKPNTDYSVSVRSMGTTEWTDLYTYNVQVDMDKVQDASMVQFDMGTPVEVKVICNAGTVQTAEVRPRSKGISPTIQENTLFFRLEQPQYLSVEINGDRKHNLHLFANPLETETYSGEGEGVMNWTGSGSKDVYIRNPQVIYFGPGVHRPKDLPNNLIRIPSNTTVYLAPGAIVKAKLLVDHAENVRIIGRGILDHPLRGIEVTYSRNVLIDGITVINPDHYTVFGGETTGLTVRNLKGFSCKGWSDGIDLMCCSDVLVDNIFLRNSDDCLALYAHRWDYWGDSRNITVQRAVLWADVAHPINIGIHGNDRTEGDTIENYTFRDIDILEHDEDDDPYRGCLAINCGDKNLVRNVLFEDIRVEDFEEGRLFHLSVYFNEKYNRAPGRGIERITFRNISYNGAGAYPSLIKGYNKECQVKDVTFEQVRVNGKLLKNLDNILTNEFVQEITVR